MARDAKGTNLDSRTGGEGLPDVVGKLLPTPTARLGESRSAQAKRYGARAAPVQPGRRDGMAWGDFEPAIRRWESVLGRPAPGPTDARGRLSPSFVEWMMGFPEGWTDDLTRTAALKALGNAVVPQQGAVALLHLLAEESHA